MINIFLTIVFISLLTIVYKFVVLSSKQTDTLKQLVENSNQNVVKFTEVFNHNQHILADSIDKLNKSFQDRDDALLKLFDSMNTNIKSWKNYQN